MAASPRQLAIQTLTKWVNLADPPALPLRDDPRWAGLSARDRNSAFDIISGVLRWRLLLDVLIAARLKGPQTQLQPPVRAILWLGLYQLLFHERTPSYAIVDTTVELAKQSGQSRAAGLINAILRGVTRLKPALEIRHGLSAATFPRDFVHQIHLAEPVFRDPKQDIWEHLSQVTSHPRTLVERLVEVHGETAATSILIRNNIRPAIILRADDPDYLPPAGAKLEAHEIAGYFVAAGGWSEVLEKEIAAGKLSPQDPTSGKPGIALVDAIGALGISRESVRLLDFCAGLGTKTMQLARALPGATVTATDIDLAKLQRLKQRSIQMKLTNISIQEPRAVVQTNDGRSAPAETQPYHGVLLDVPCSNSGVMGRRPQSRWRWPALDIAALRRTQLGILAQGASLVANPGFLVYATCSIDPAENQEVIHAFLKTQEGEFSLEQEQTTLPCPSDAAQQQYDGGYFALLARRPTG